MIRVPKLATPHSVKRAKRNNQLLLCEAPKLGLFVQIYNKKGLIKSLGWKSNKNSCQKQCRFTIGIFSMPWEAYTIGYSAANRIKYKSSDLNF